LGRGISGSVVLLVLTHELEGRKHFGLEVAPGRDREVEFDVGQVDEHASDLGSQARADESVDVLVDAVAHHVLLLHWVSLLELLGHEHLLHLNSVLLSVSDVDIDGSGRGGHG